MECKTLAKYKEEILERIIWSALEDERIRVTRRANKLLTDYTPVEIIKCASDEFHDRVRKDVLQAIAYKELMGKKYNAKRIANRAVKYEACLLYGKKG